MKDNNFNTEEPVIKRSIYENKLYERVKDVKETAQKLIDDYNKLKDLYYCNEHKSLFLEMETFLERHNQQP